MNSKASSIVDSDLQFCWQQVLRVRPQFRISHPYAPPAISVSLLAVHALLASLEETVCGASDEIVSRTKLAWWQQELLVRELSDSQHPIVRVLNQSMGLTASMHGGLRRLLDLSLDRIDSAAPRDEAGLSLLCGKLGYSAMQLEISLESGGDVEETTITRACRVAGLLLLLRESARSKHRSYWWLPLNLLARFGVSRSEISDGDAWEPMKMLLERVCSGVLDPHLNASDGTSSEANMEISGYPYFPRHRHWSVQCALEARLLSRLKGIHPKRYATEFSRTRPTDAWHAWWAARKWIERERTV